MAVFQRAISVHAADDLPKIFAFVEQACEDAQVAPDLRFDLQLAVEEACCNVIEHAYGGTGGEFTVRFASQDQDVVITLHDRGRPFAPGEIARPDLTLPLEQRPIGGLGLHIIYQLMDDVRFTFAEDGNTLVMVKRNAIRGQEGNG